MVAACWMSAYVFGSGRPAEAMLDTDAAGGVPSFDLTDPRYDAQRYWRGPTWLNTTWLVARGLHSHGRHEL